MNLRAYTGIFLSALALTSCQTMEQRVAGFADQCEAQGFQKGTQGNLDCVAIFVDADKAERARKSKVLQDYQKSINKSTDAQIKAYENAKPGTTTCVSRRSLGEVITECN